MKDIPVWFHFLAINETLQEPLNLEMHQFILFKLTFYRWHNGGHVFEVLTVCVLFFYYSLMIDYGYVDINCDWVLTKSISFLS